MSVLDRKMFATGDVAGNPFVDSYDEFEPYQLNFTIEPKGEGFVAVQRNPRGEVVKETPINTALSVTGDPVEAYQVQTKNEALRAIRDTGLGILGIRSGQFLLKPALKYFGPKFTKAVTSNRFLNPFTSKKLPGVATPGRKGFQPLDPTKLSSYQIGLKPGAKFGIFSGLGLGGLTAAQTTEEEVAEELRKLEEQQGSAATKKQEVKDKTAIDPYFGGISDEEIDKVLGVSQDKINKEVEDQDQINQDALIKSFTDFQDRMLDDKNLNRLLRNTGVNLVKEGRFSGIASGAAAAATERAAEEVLESEREAEQRLQQMKSGGVDISDLKAISGLEQEYLENYQASQDNKNTAKQVQDVINVLKTQGQNVFGVGNIISSNIKQIMKFVAGDPNLASKAKDIEKNLKTENPRLYIKTILEIVQNREIKELLGESGRTISNLDRQVVERIVGQLKDTSIFGQDPLTIAAKLELLVEDQIKQQRANEEKAIAVARNLVLAGRDPSQLISATQEKAEKRVRITI